jgi:hypothetical protein
MRQSKKPSAWVSMFGVGLIVLLPSARGGAAETSTAYTWEVRVERTELASRRQEAIECAQQKAAEQIASWLRQVWPDGSWTPTPLFLRDRRIIYDVYTESVILELPEGPKLMFAGVALCRLTPETWRELLEQSRLAESQRRLWMLGKYGFAPAMVAWLVLWLLWPKPTSGTAR